MTVVTQKSRSMSSGLMSCVRENSPPLELNASGPLSLPERSCNESSDSIGIKNSPALQHTRASSTPLNHTHLCETDGGEASGESVNMSFNNSNALFISTFLRIADESMIFQLKVKIVKKTSGKDQAMGDGETICADQDFTDIVGSMA
uniref:Uncharacterized protein n=1 Tax=Glossina palpalis gambiensis TaxID=67801 RepID=A0A1B0B2I0_9MUSC